MTATISTWGNSQGLRFPKELMKKLSLSIGDKMEIFIDKQKIILEPLTKPREKIDIQDLIAQLPKEDTNTPVFEAFDDIQGKEQW
jgi:antitoxin MazE